MSNEFQEEVRFGGTPKPAREDACAPRNCFASAACVKSPIPDEVKAQIPIIPDHELLRVIGRGAYGEIWLARTVTGAFRAVKVVYRSTFESERAFFREFEGMSAFEPISRGHAGFINILHVGRTTEYLYYSMELADDHLDGRKIDIGSYEPRTLKTDLARHKRFSADESIMLGLSLTEALEALHKRGLSHRDIKPSNIISAKAYRSWPTSDWWRPADSVHSLARKVTSRRKGRARRVPTFTVWANFFTKPAPEKTGSIFRRSIRN